MGVRVYVCAGGGEEMEGCKFWCVEACTCGCMINGVRTSPTLYTLHKTATINLTS